MYGASTRIEVLDLVPRQRILIEWGESGKRSQVEWNFTARSTHETMVMVRNFGFVGDEASVVSEAIDSMGGFSLMLANAKAWLEHGIDLRLIVDHAPDALVDNWA